MGRVYVATRRTTTRTSSRSPTSGRPRRQHRRARPPPRRRRQHCCVCVCVFTHIPHTCPYTYSLNPHLYSSSLPSSPRTSPSCAHPPPSAPHPSIPAPHPLLALPPRYPTTWPATLRTDFANVTASTMKASEMRLINVLGQDDNPPVAAQIAPLLASDDVDGMLFYGKDDALHKHTHTHTHTHHAHTSCTHSSSPPLHSPMRAVTVLCSPKRVHSSLASPSPPRAPHAIHPPHRTAA